MRKVFLLLALIVVGVGLKAQSFNAPESVAFDEEGNRFIVTNAAKGSSGGSIVAFYVADRKIETFVAEGVDSPKGAVIENGILFVTDVTSVKGYSLKTAELVFYVKVPGAVFLNDIASDGANLYISDSAANKLFKIGIANKEVSLLSDDKHLDRPNGLYYESEGHRLIICSFRANTTIQEYNLTMNMLSSVVPTTLSQLDGIARDAAGNYYFSSWASNAVYKFAPDFKGTPVEVTNGHYGPADIFVAPGTQELVVPNFLSNKIDFVSIAEKSIEDTMNPYGIKIYPNPAVSNFMVDYKLESNFKVDISLMSKSGRKIQQLEFDEKTPGNYSLKVELKNLGIEKGIYFIKIIIAEDVFMKRIIVLE